MADSAKSPPEHEADLLDVLLIIPLFKILGQNFMQFQLITLKIVSIAIFFLNAFFNVKNITILERNYFQTNSKENAVQ